MHMNRAAPIPRAALCLTVCLGALVALVRAQPAQTVSFSPPAATFTDAFSVQLGGAAAGQHIRYVMASGPNADAAEVTASSPVYSGPLTFTTTTLIRAAVFNADSTTPGRVTSGHYVKLGANVSGFRSALPVLVLDDLGAGPLEKDGVNHASWLFGFASIGGVPTFSRAANFNTPVVSTVRGTSSAEFPKKGYNIRMRDAAARSRAFPIFDLPAYERWALVAPWSYDATFFNNAFVYELSNRIGRWAPRTKLVEMFFNTGADELDQSDYAGIYVVTDRIRVEPGRVAIAKLGTNDTTEPAITGGYLLQLEPPEPGDVSWVTSRGVPEQKPSEIVLAEPGAEDVTAVQLAYIKDYVQKMEDALHADLATRFEQRSYLDFIDRSSWVDHHILNVLVSNPDALHRSAYFTKPRGGRMQAGPVWDFDRAVGGFWDDRTSVIDTWSGLQANVDVWRTGWWGVLAQDPDFVQEWIDRWQTLRRAEFSTDALTTLAQTFADTIGLEAAQRDVARWPDSASPRGSYLAQIAYLKDWLRQRTEWIDAQFVAPPTTNLDGSSITYMAPDGALLAYTLDGSDPRAVGGGISPEAHLHAGPLTVPATTNVRVRSYDPVPRDTFPSSPWSTFADTVLVSSATAQGRIVNLSSKATLTAGQPDGLIIGFVVQDAPAKRYLIRGVGPGLAGFGETNALRTPRLVVTAASGAVIAQNAGWPSDPAAAQLPSLAQSVGAFPFVAGSADAATLLETPRGNFTVQITSTTAQAGAVLGELYELDQAGRTANVSIRARASGGEPLIGGFVIMGGTNRVLIRAIGPTLRDFGVADAAGDPSLILRAGNAIIATNDSWLAGANGPAVEEAATRTGAFPLPAGSQDAGLVATLPAGNYTVEVKAAGAGGTVLLEIYDVP